jgi:membrane protein DedA with SNARE-associated domain
MINFLISKTLDIFLTLGYTGLFISALGIFPTEILIASLAAHPEYSLTNISFVTALGETLGSYPLFFIGYALTGKKVYKWIENNGKILKIDRDSFDKSRKKILKKSYIYVFLTRFVPWIRLVASMAGGFLRINFFLYSFSVFAGVFIYTYVIAYFGKRLGGNLELIQKYISIADKWLVLIIAIYLVISLGYKNRKKIAKWLISLKKK